MNTETYELLRQALTNQKSIEIINHGKKQTTRRVICPHILGTKKGGMLQVLGYHLRGESSSSGTIDPNDYEKAYRNMNVENVEIVKQEDGSVFIEEWKSVPGYWDYWYDSFDIVHEFVPDVGMSGDSENELRSEDQN
jgi:hypothetical protein